MCRQKHFKHTALQCSSYGATGIQPAGDGSLSNLPRNLTFQAEKLANSFDELGKL